MKRFDIALAAGLFGMLSRAIPESWHLTPGNAGLVGLVCGLAITPSVVLVRALIGKERHG